MIIRDDFLNRMRLQGDVPADKLVADSFAGGTQQVLYELLKCDEKEILTSSKSAIQNFLISRRANPVWFNLSKVQNGQRLFAQYALEIMALLGSMSLPYCYAASPGNKALYLADKMRNSPGKRLMDTAAFVIEVLSPGSFDDQQKNRAHLHINKVRLVHALSRYHVKKPPKWDMRWGQPINQEDMAGTNLAFSYVILLGLQQSGYALSQKDREDFIFVWRYIGYLLHVDKHLLPSSFAQAGQLATLIKRRNFRETEEGKVLTSELLSYYKSNLPAWQAELVASQVRFYLGDEVARLIGLAGDPILDRVTSSINTFKSLQNMLSIKQSSYQEMLFQHLLLKKKVI